MTVQSEAIILRTLEKGDIPDRIHWETVETEWQLWDSPWDHEDKTEAQRAEVYTQTWSGNVRMIALAEKLGFVQARSLHRAGGRPMTD